VADGPDPAARLWPEGTATGVGSLPGADVRAALELVLDTVPDLPFVPELPGRGPGAEMTGRTLALLPGIGAEWGPGGWMVASSAGRDLRRAASYLDEDLDVVEELLQGWDGPLKTQLCGPWTLAATFELHSGRRALADAGAVRDLGQALAEAAGAHCADLAHRVPGARILLQVDEPALVAVLRGELPTPSGLTTIAAVDEPVVEHALRAVADAVVAAGAVPLLHTCVAGPPVELLVRSGFRALSLDATLLTRSQDDPIGEAVEDGTTLMLGLVPTRGELPEGPDAGLQVAAAARALWNRTGLASDLLGNVAVTPTCGLAGASPEHARSALALSRAAARTLVTDPQDVGTEGSRG
jgi:hypothetical protein